MFRKRPEKSTTGVCKTGTGCLPGDPDPDPNRATGRYDGDSRMHEFTDRKHGWFGADGGEWMKQYGNKPFAKVRL